MPTLELSRRGQRGFTIVEIMVAIGIGGIVLVGAVQIYSTIIQMQTSSEQGQAVVAMVNDVQKMMTSDPVCTAALVGIASTEGSDVVLGPQLRAGGTYGKLSITAMKLRTISTLAPQTQTAQIEIVGTKAGQVFGSKNFVRQLRVFYQTDVSNNILKCLAANRSPASDCASLGGSWTGTTCDFCTGLGGTRQGASCVGVGGGNNNGSRRCVTLTNSLPATNQMYQSNPWAQSQLQSWMTNYQPENLADAQSAIADLQNLGPPHRNGECVTQPVGSETETDCHYQATYGSVSFDLHEHRYTLSPQDCAGPGTCNTDWSTATASMCAYGR